jgi:hypothetical protein
MLEKKLPGKMVMENGGVAGIGLEQVLLFSYWIFLR